MQVSLAQHDDMIQTVTADAADGAFAIWILPGRLRCDRDFFDSHVLDPFLKVVAVDAVAIANEEARCFFVREGIDNLLGGPFGVWIRGHVEVNNLR